MKRILVLLLALFLSIAGCLDSSTQDDGTDGEGEGDDGDDDDMDDNRTVPDQLEFSFGPSAGCDGSTVGPETCVSFTGGPEASGVDGFWLALSEDYEGLEFTSTIESNLGDSDCVFVDADGGVISDANQGADPCAGTVPSGTAHLFIYPYVEPSQGMTVTFQAP